jgi:hypothetical protein
LTSITQPWVPTVDGEFTASSTLSNPYPTGLIQPPQRNPNYQTLLLGNSIRAPVLGAVSQHFGYLQQWNFNIERELLPGMALEVA